MTLTGRLLSFYLTALAVILLGFSAGLYLLARTYLYRQVDNRVNAALETLVAAAEINSEGVEWEPNERLLALGEDSAEDQVRWLIRDDSGRMIDCSRNLGADIGVLLNSDSTDKNGRWQLDSRTLYPGPVTLPTRSDPKDAEAPKPEVRYAALNLTAAVSLTPVRTTLRNLAITLCGLSVVLWSIALVLGRRLCHSALRPVTQMAEMAKGMDANDRTRRLPCPPTRDELEDLVRAFNGLLDRLHEAFERQSQFTGDASHQLRTPLTAMIGQIEVALRRRRSPEEYEQTLQTVADQAAHLRQLVELLLFLARADAEARLPELEVVELSRWLPEKLAAWSQHPRHVDIRTDVQVASGSDSDLVRVHPPLLGQLVDNLVDNACKYTPPGTPICVRWQQNANRVFLTVEDRAGNMDPEDLPHIFEPFFRSVQARREGKAGVGLGLTVARRIAEAFGGMLTANCKPGEVTCFTLELPCAEP
jgi:signal transduction histidine kinase